MYNRAKHHVKRAYKAVFGGNDEEQTTQRPRRNRRQTEDDASDSGDDEQRQQRSDKKLNALEKRKRALARKAEREQQN